VTDARRPISEDELHAYIDGQLDPGRRQEVERYLQAYPAVAQRAAGYSTQRDSLRAAFAESGVQPLPSSLNLTRLIEERLGRRRLLPWFALAGIVLAFGFGGTGGWLLGERPPAGMDALVAEAAASYAVHASDKGRPVELWAPQRDDLVRWVSNRLNRAVAPPDLSALGYQLLGGRLVATSHGPAALFLYEAGNGTRLAVFVRPMVKGRTRPIEQVDIGDMDGCAWIDRGIGYTVIAAESYERLLEISEQVRQQAQAAG
jgi:anti-sigma factor RsiW